MGLGLGAVQEVADLSLGKMLDQNKNRGEYLPYLANVNVRWGSFDLSSLREMRFESHERTRYGLQFGDIVMCEGGEPGRCALWKDVDFPVLVPSLQVMAQFVRVAWPLRQQIQKLLQQNAGLRRARDLLLPRLISGGLAV